MTGKLLFLGGGSRFLMNAVVNQLKNARYEVVSIAPEAAAEGVFPADAGAAVVYLGPALTEQPEALRALRDFCAEGDRRLFLIGEDSEVGQWIDFFSGDLVAGGFTKPLDMRKFLAAVNALTGHPEQQRKLILLVDDDGDYLKLVSGWLSASYRVVFVNSGMQAITYLASNKPDLILLDYAMPVTSGPQVLEMIRSEPATAEIPVIFLTGKRDKDSVTKVLELEPEGYILKSIGKDTLLARVDEFFRDRESGAPEDTSNS